MYNSNRNLEDGSATVVRTVCAIVFCSLWQSMCFSIRKTHWLSPNIYSVVEQPSIRESSEASSSPSCLHSCISPLPRSCALSLSVFMPCRAFRRYIY